MTQKEKLQICVEALRELVTPKGAFDIDQFKHAKNTIAETSSIAIETLEKIQEPINKP